MDNSNAFIKIRKGAKRAKIIGSEFEGDRIHIDTEEEDTEMAENTHREGKKSNQPHSSDSLRLTD